MRESEKKKKEKKKGEMWTQDLTNAESKRTHSEAF